jgi:hypothetical protein
VDAADQFEDQLSVFRIEIAGRLVGQDQWRAVDDGAGNRHALHLAAGELVRKVRRSPFQSHFRQHLGHARLDLGARNGSQRQRKGHVLEHIQRRDEIEKLEDVADRFAAQHRQARFVQRGGFDVVEQQASRGGLVNGTDQVEQR